MNTRKMTDILFCINVYKNPSFLLQQLKTISDNVKCSYVVVLSCNDYMFIELKKITLPDNVIINPEVINKFPHTGRFLQGIVSNMNYGVKNFTFKYTVMLSARTIFYKNMSLSDLDVLKTRFNSMEDIEKYRGPFDTTTWWWPHISQSMLAKHYLNLGYKLHNSEHEGMGLSYNVSKNVLNFLNARPEICNDFISCGCAEEFGLQTISHIEVDPTNLEYGFFNIGHGVTENYDPLLKNKYTRKIRFPG